MPSPTAGQRKTTGRVMHEFKHGELKSGPGGKGGKVKNRRQAIAIALKEAGASKYESKSEKKKNLAKSKRKEARGETYQQEREGKSHVGARPRRAPSRKSKTARRPPSRSSSRRRSGTTKAELYRRARAKGIPGRSKMSKSQLERALQ